MVPQPLMRRETQDLLPGCRVSRPAPGGGAEQQPCALASACDLALLFIQLRIASSIRPNHRFISISCPVTAHFIGNFAASPPTIIIRIMSMRSSMPCMRQSAPGAPPGCLRLADRKLRDVRRKLADLASMEVVLSALVGVCHVHKGNLSCTRIDSLQAGSSWASQNRGGLSIPVGPNLRSPTLTTPQADRRFRIEAACEIAHDGAHRAAATHLASVAPRFTRRTSAVALLSAGSPAA